MEINPLVWHNSIFLLSVVKAKYRKNSTNIAECQGM